MRYSCRSSNENAYILYCSGDPVLELKLQQLPDGLYCFDLWTGELDGKSGPALLEFAGETGNGFAETAFLFQKLPLFSKENDKLVFLL